MWALLLWLSGLRHPAVPIEDLLLLDAAEIVGGRGDEALRAHVELQSLGELPGVTALVGTAGGGFSELLPWNWKQSLPDTPLGF